MTTRFRKQTFFRTLPVVLTERDELALSRVIKEFSPDALVLDDQSSQSSPPAIDSIAHGTSWAVSVALPAPGQEKRWQINAETNNLLVRPLVRFDLRRSAWQWLNPERKWAFDIPLFGWGEITVGYPRDDETMKKFAGKLLRLVNKVTAKDNAFGLDASLWSQAGHDVGERRGLGVGQVVNPHDDIELNAYYDDSLWGDRLPNEPVWTRNIELPANFRRI